MHDIAPSARDGIITALSEVEWASQPRKVLFKGEPQSYDEQTEEGAKWRALEYAANALHKAVFNCAWETGANPIDFDSDKKITTARQDLSTAYGKVHDYTREPENCAKAVDKYYRHLKQAATKLAETVDRHIEAIPERPQAAGRG